jgi:nicotinamide riboside transporter PnuC
MLIAEIIMVILSVIGSLLNARQNKYGMAIWVAADSIGVPFFWVLGKYYMVALYVFWTINSAYGFWYWGRKENEKVQR